MKMRHFLPLLTLAACHTAAMAESFTLKTSLPVGSSLKICLDPGLNVTFKWGNGTTVTETSTAKPISVEVRDAQLTVTTDGNITQLYVNDNAIDEISVANLRQLLVLDCNDNRLSSLSLSHQPALTTLWCARNALKALDLSKHPYLERLNASGNRLGELKLSTTRLTDIWVEGNELGGTLDLAGQEALYSIAADHNGLAKIDLNNGTAAKKALKYFYANDNALYYNSLPTFYDKSKEEYTITAVATPQRPYFYTHGLLTGVQHDLSDLIRYNGWQAALTPEVTLTDTETGKVLAEGEDFTKSGSYKFTFSSEHRHVTATVESAMYPGLALTTEPFAILSDLSGLQEITAGDGTETPAYDLQGRRIGNTEAYRGIYVQGGKKAMRP